MNTLCHLCLGLDDPEFLLGQFLGDFTRGSVEELPYSDKVKQGIRAHRRVDAAGETHPFLSFAKQLLPPKDRRYGGIVLDLYGDYLLFRCWDKLISDSWESVYAQITNFLQSPPAPFPHQAENYAHFLLQYEIFPSYAQSSALPQIFDRVGRRFRNPVCLSRLLYKLQKQEDDFIQRFPDYFNDMKTASDHLRLSAK
ncbi:ACP phosphodiesterase [Kiritimatiellota bacterium B12222]|nr:ACP phosphodiesterase [Kiritimatiellota bacterium B12222]